MVDFDKLPLDKKAEINRECRLEDARAYYHQQLYNAQRWFQGEMYNIELQFREEMKKANLPKLIKTPWGVLFA